MTAVESLAFQDGSKPHDGRLSVWNLDAHVRLTRNRRLDAKSLCRERQGQIPLQIGDLRHAHLHLLRILGLDRTRTLDEAWLHRKLRDCWPNAVSDHRRRNPELRQGLHDHASRLIDGPIIGASRPAPRAGCSAPEVRALEQRA